MVSKVKLASRSKWEDREVVIQSKHPCAVICWQYGISLWLLLTSTVLRYWVNWSSRQCFLYYELSLKELPGVSACTGPLQCAPLYLTLLFVTLLQGFTTQKYIYICPERQLLNFILCHSVNCYSSINLWKAEKRVRKFVLLMQYLATSINTRQSSAASFGIHKNLGRRQSIK